MIISGNVGQWSELKREVVKSKQRELAKQRRIARKKELAKLSALELAMQEAIEDSPTWAMQKMRSKNHREREEELERVGELPRKNKPARHPEMWELKGLHRMDWRVSATRTSSVESKKSELTDIDRLIPKLKSLSIH